MTAVADGRVTRSDVSQNGHALVVVTNSDNGFKLTANDHRQFLKYTKYNLILWLLSILHNQATLLQTNLGIFMFSTDHIVPLLKPVPQQS